MKKLILLVLVAFMGVQVISAAEQLKRHTPAARANFFVKKYALSEEQKQEIIKLYTELEEKNIEDDKEYQKGLGVISKTITTDIVTAEQKEAAANK